MEGFNAQTLLDLIRVYDVALAELRAMNDAAVQPLADRLRELRGKASMEFAWRKLAEREPTNVVA